MDFQFLSGPPCIFELCISVPVELQNFTLYSYKIVFNFIFPLFYISFQQIRRNDKYIIC